MRQLNRFQRRFTGAGKAGPLLLGNALGTVIVKLIDATEGGTELTYKHFSGTEADQKTP
jgi:hypothetical protein